MRRTASYKTYGYIKSTAIRKWKNPWLINTHIISYKKCAKIGEAYTDSFSQKNIPTHTETLATAQLLSIPR